MIFSPKMIYDIAIEKRLLKNRHLCNNGPGNKFSWIEKYKGKKCNSEIANFLSGSNIRHRYIMHKLVECYKDKDEELKK